MKYKVIPITLRQANEFIEANHRHHKSVVGAKFSVGLTLEGALVGVAIAGRPVARMESAETTIEVNRLCTTGEKNACFRNPEVRACGNVTAARASASSNPEPSARSETSDSSHTAQVAHGRQPELSPDNRAASGLTSSETEKWLAGEYF